MNNENTQAEMASSGQRMEVGVIAARYATYDLTHDEAQALIGDPKPVGKVIKDAIRNYLKSLPRTLAQRIARARLDWVNSDIAEKNFQQIPCESEYTLETVHPGRNMSTDEVLEYIKALGPEFEPADVHDLADYGADHPDEQRKHPIAELASVWVSPGGHRFVAYLCGRGSGRGLYLDYVAGGWRGYYRFLVRRKKQSA